MLECSSLLEFDSGREVASYSLDKLFLLLSIVFLLSECYCWSGHAMQMI